MTALTQPAQTPRTRSFGPSLSPGVVCVCVHTYSYTYSYPAQRQALACIRQSNTNTITSSHYTHLHLFRLMLTTILQANVTPTKYTYVSMYKDVKAFDEIRQVHH